MGQWITNLDFSLLYAIQQGLRSPWLDSLCAGLSVAFEWGIPWILLSGLLFCFKKTRTAAAVLLAALALTFFFNELAIKNAVQRLRPCAIDPTVILAVKKPLSYSFTSGHTATAFAAVGSLLFTYKKLGIPLLAFAAIMGFSRMYLFVHFPTDVLAGAVLGLLMAWVTVLIFRELKYDKKLESLNIKLRREQSDRT